MPEQEKSIQQQQIENIAQVISTPRINEDDKVALRSMFAGRLELVTALRNVFFGNATDQERYMVAEATSSDEAKRVLKKIILPEIASDDPFKQSIDLWQTVAIKDETDERVPLVIEARRLLIDMLRQALKILDDSKAKAPDIDIDSKPLEKITYVTLTARNTFISHVENQMVAIWTMANSTPESPDERNKRFKKNSNK